MGFFSIWNNRKERELRELVDHATSTWMEIYNLCNKIRINPLYGELENSMGNSCYNKFALIIDGRRVPSILSTVNCGYKQTLIPKTLQIHISNLYDLKAYGQIVRCRYTPDCKLISNDELYQKHFLVIDNTTLNELTTKIDELGKDFNQLQVSSGVLQAYLMQFQILLAVLKVMKAQIVQ